MESTDTILQVQGLSVSFGALRAVDSVDMAVRRSGVTSLIGPNGAGKSTLFNLISGAIRPSAGKVLFNGVNVTGWSPHKLLRAGMARSFQITNLFFDMSVRENLRLASQILEPAGKAWWPLSRSHRAAERVEEQLERFSLQGRADALAGELSHGEQRRLEIAVALASGPQLLMLDEPTQGMSHGDTQEAAQLIKTLSSEVGILLVEHDVNLVMDVSDHIVVLSQGKKLAEGRPADVRANPQVQAAYFGGAHAAA
ncbi:ABC transporter ATP-binding protein [Paracandidimonas soli]|uniref:Amino acid/amide ABC transporter ATP-binding protein 1 (HAAT family) n=1 Tax=Paracandidimonas soli TaxID=1917182 RepID=A0A4R3VGB8_9BURK|nr:ABC transporter ATP-binding protein [Paracandidimonas soli]TCV01895.1 amino acid/amide ABC transporter ATP-binding protein 1 (HAAT family) [Paracandidimonas soli]